MLLSSSRTQQSDACLKWDFTPENAKEWDFARLRFPLTDGPVEVPLLAMDFSRPLEGFPPVVQVLKWSESLFCGYERHREPLEVYPLCEPGSLLYSGAVAISKGYTRGSILCFGIVQSLMKEDVSTFTADEADYFTQWLGLFLRSTGHQEGGYIAPTL